MKLPPPAPAPIFLFAMEIACCTANAAPRNHNSIFFGLFGSRKEGWRCRLCGRAWQGTTGDLAAPARLQPQQPAGRERDEARDGCLRKNDKNEKQKRFSLRCKTVPSPQSHPTRCGGPRRFPRARCHPGDTLPAQEKVFSGVRSW